MKRQIAQMLLILLVVIGITSLVTGGEIGVTKDKIKIGVFSALTGPYAEYNVMWSQGGKVIIDEANKKGGIHGRKIEYVVEDDACSSTKGAIAAKKLIYDEKVFCLYAGVCTGATTATLPDVAAMKVPLVVCGAGGSSLSRPFNKGPSGKYVFGGPALVQYNQGKFAIKWFVSTKGWKRIAVVYHPDLWGAEMYNGAKDQMKEYGMDFVAAEEIIRDATDASVQVLKIKEKKPDAVLLILYPRIGPIFLRQAYQLGLHTNLLAAIGTVSHLGRLRETAGDEALTNFYYVSGLCDILGGPRLAPWLKKIREAFPDKAKDPEFPNVYVFYGVGTGTVFVEGLRRAGPDLTREKFITALEGMKDFETGVLSSRVTYGPNDRVTNEDGIVVKFTGPTEKVVYRP